MRVCGLPKCVMTRGWRAAFGRWCVLCMRERESGCGDTRGLAARCWPASVDAESSFLCVLLCVGRSGERDPEVGIYKKRRHPPRAHLTCVRSNDLQTHLTRPINPRYKLTRGRACSTAQPPLLESHLTHPPRPPTSYARPAYLSSTPFEPRTYLHRAQQQGKGGRSAAADAPRGLWSEVV